MSDVRLPVNSLLPNSTAVKFFGRKMLSGIVDSNLFSYKCNSRILGIFFPSASWMGPVSSFCARLNSSNLSMVHSMFGMLPVKELLFNRKSTRESEMLQRTLGNNSPVSMLSYRYKYSRVEASCTSRPPDILLPCRSNFVSVGDLSRDEGIVPCSLFCPIRTSSKCFSFPRSNGSVPLSWLFSTFTRFNDDNQGTASTPPLNSLLARYNLRKC
mmetsp:Transcript_31347/g.67708  ORF Transcript_31347/g.67708 Transcript_31347/m.67708 type:complete len:213 (-) Transcript_31347:58-696(-)